MAEHLASIFGTEKDRVNCPFYFKIGAFRHGDRCSRLHTKSSINPTLLLPNMFQRPIDPLKIQQHFEVGNMYVQFREEEQAAKALKSLIGRLYAGRPIIVEFSNVTNFHEASCIQYEDSSCNRGGYCNFMHLKKISRLLLLRIRHTAVHIFKESEQHSL